MKWRFAAKFLVAFALLVTAWWVVGFGSRYRTAVLATVHVVSPIVNGWWLEYDQPGLIDPVVYRSGNRQLPMLLNLPQLSMGFLPFLSLVAATPGLGLRRAIVVAALGSTAYFVIHVIVVLVYPVILDQPNFVKDTIGVFSGLVAFVLAPLGLWFVLTYPVLRSVWQLTPNVR
jgi:hypothetical protein